MAARSLMRAAMAALFVCAAATARDAEDRLGAILLPHEGAPAIAAPGARVEVLLATAPSTLHVTRGDVQWDVATDVVGQPDGTFLATCGLPPVIDEGWYGIEASDDNGVPLDATQRCIYIGAHALDGVAHIAAPRVGEDGNSLRRAIAFAAEQGAPLVIVTGDLTADGSAASFRQVLAVVRDAPVPVLATPGTGDEAQGLSDAYIGGRPHMTRYGADGFLAFSTAKPLARVQPAAETSALYTMRRALMPSRWTIGATSRYSGALDMRTQLVLFVDWPLDVLFVSELEALPKLIDRPNPWGTTTILQTPPLAEGTIRLVPFSQDEPGEGELVPLVEAQAP